MKLIDRFTASVKYILQGSQNRAYPDTYEEELEYQNRRLTPLAVFLWSFAWLPYIPIDLKMHPNHMEFPILRIGLSCVAGFGLVLWIWKPFKYWSTFFVCFSLFYITGGAGLATLFSHGNPAYMGGFLICLMLVSLMAPVPFVILLLALSLTYVSFIAGVLLLGIRFETLSQIYSLQDLTTVTALTYILGYIQHRIRKSNYTRAKEIERQKAIVEIKEAESNRLLLNILPEKIADELKANGATKPIRIDSATVMFTDFVGFTRISEKLSAEDVVDELDKCFSYFDQVTEKYRLEKLKTIGDSFMCAGGLPTHNHTHAIDCCLAALEIQAFMNQMKEIKKQQGFDYWELRLGMNTGPLVAGVVGHKKFAYDVWGDTVNTASRLESSGVPGKINIAVSTYELVKDLFNCEHRGQVKAKNKGEIDMYFLNGIKPDYSVKGEGRVPNESFQDKYRNLAQARVWNSLGDGGR